MFSEWASQGALVVKNLPANAGDMRDAWSLDGDDLLEEGKATQASIPAWESHGQKSLVGYSPQGHKEANTTEVRAHVHGQWAVLCERLLKMRNCNDVKRQKMPA